LNLKTETGMQLVEAQAPDRFTPQPPHSLPINDALQIKAAEYWLKIGRSCQRPSENGVILAV
jgi:hypothetical protein